MFHPVLGSALSFAHGLAVVAGMVCLSIDLPRTSSFPFMPTLGAWQ